jgi:quercetin dioxygenase-like cupin family protein
LHGSDNDDELAYSNEKSQTEKHHKRIFMPFIPLSECPAKELLPGFSVKFVHSAHMTFAHWTVTAGSVLPVHSHPHEQVAHILEGTFELTIDGTSKLLDASTIGVIPPNAIHSGRAVTDCRILDVFYPIREDYR